MSLLALVAFSLPGSAHAGVLECGTNVGCMFVDGVMQFAGKLFATFFFVGVQLFGIFLGWIAAFFNTAAIVTVFQFSRYFGNSEGLLLAWGILRDLANITLLFGFVFIGVATILGIQKYAATKALPTLIMFAVLLNFSLFITEATIDISNAIGASFFSQAGGTECGFAYDFKECAGRGISGQIMATAGISSIFDTNAWMQNFNNIVNADNGIAAAILYLGILALIIVLTAVMFAGAIILVSRAVTLMLIMVTSPIGFAGMAVPGLNKVAKQWWDALIENVIFAPVFILLILVGLKISEGARNSLVGEGFSIATMLSSGEPAGIGTVFVMFALIVGFFWGALMFAKKSGVFGASAIAAGAQKWAGNAIGGFTVYPAAGVANGMNRIYNQGARVVRRVTPAPIRTLAGVFGGSALDEGIRSGLSSVGSAKIPGTGMRSYNDLTSAREKRRNEMKKLDKEQRGNSIAENLGLSGTEAQKEAKEREEYFKQRKEDKANNEKLETGTGADVAQVLQKMSLPKVEEHLKTSNKNLSEIAKNLTPERFEKMIDSKEISESKKRTLINERFKEAADAANRGDGKTIRGIASKDLELLAKYNSEAFEKIVTHKDPATGGNLMSDDQNETLAKLGDKLRKDQIQMLKANSRTARLEEAVRAGNTTQARQWAKNMSPKAYAKSHPDVLTNPQMVSDYDAGTLATIMSENNSLAKQQLKLIGQMVRDPGHPNAGKIRGYFSKNPAADAHFSP